jgi:hypothetical protein
MMNITLNFSLDEINALLTALGQLPYSQSAPLIQSIHAQAIPQIPVNNPEPEVVNG